MKCGGYGVGWLSIIKFSGKKDPGRVKPPRTKKQPATQVLEDKGQVYMQFKSGGTTCSKYFFIWVQLTGRSKIGSFSFSASAK